MCMCICMRTFTCVRVHRRNQWERVFHHVAFMGLQMARSGRYACRLEAPTFFKGMSMIWKASSMTGMLCKCCLAQPFFNFESYLLASFPWLIREWSWRTRAAHVPTSSMQLAVRALGFTRQPLTCMMQIVGASNGQQIVTDLYFQVTPVLG